MSCKIIDIRTGEEIKGPELLACYKRAPAKFRRDRTSREVEVSHRGEGFQPIGYAAERLLIPLARKMTRK